ncbi:universal stress protein [Sphingomonas sp. PB2P19]|uniref:universal stress protein n=1 Tax=Sphingomonas rhamnosi TaxID=3096156 RepID=UPI002FCC0A37
MKNILLLAHDDSGQEARFQAAVDVCRAVRGHLVCLDVTIMPTFAGGEYAAGFGGAALLAEEIDSETVNRARLDGRLQHEDVPWNWIEATGDLVACIKDAAGLADLIVVNRQLDDFAVPDMRGVAGELVLKAGRPILAVPPTLKRFDLSRALVAWNGSAAAEVALRAAVPLLRLSDVVTLIEVDDRSVRTPAENAAAYLSREGVAATVDRVTPVGREHAADVIVRHAAHGHAGYIVMGGFGHPRFVEALIGGTTRHLLTHSPVPLFLAH